MKKVNIDTPKGELEKVLGDLVGKEIEKIHESDRPTRHADEKGVYDLYPNGEKKYI